MGAEKFLLAKLLAKSYHDHNGTFHLGKDEAMKRYALAAVGVVVALGVGGCATPSEPAAPLSTTIVSSTPDPVAMGPVSSYLIAIRSAQPDAGNYNDRQLIFMGDQFCVIAADMLTEQWAEAGHSLELLGAVADHVRDNPKYCAGTEPVWPGKQVTVIGEAQAD